LRPKSNPVYFIHSCIDGTVYLYEHVYIEIGIKRRKLIGKSSRSGCHGEKSICW